MKPLILSLMLFALPIAARSEWLEQPVNPLHLSSTNGFFRSDISGLLDLEGYYVDQRPPGLLYGDNSFFNPRLSLFLDAHLGSHIYIFAEGRVDRGFDPKSVPDGEARGDQYFARYTPFADERLNLQAGKFAMVFGNWAARHDSWDNPLINAPLPYENITTVSDQSVPASPAVFLARRQLADRKELWLPAVWGPGYTSGASAFGSVERFDYAAEFKNASLSSRPEVWSATDVGWEHPTFTGRIGFRPDAAWNFGLSASGGAYLQPSAAAALPSGKSRGDYWQYAVGHDLSFAWHHWQVWGEVILSRFEVPNVGNADTLAYYVETKYKINTRLFAAARWNQQFFGKVRDGLGGREAWDNDAWRVDAALGCRFNRHIQAKVQYSFNHQHGSLQQGEQLVAAQFTAKF